MSCNGCRVLRKGCSDDCIIRPCLQWIPSPDSQANATIFLAKFYGRAGLFNLITAASEHLRPAIFKSLLYEACGRMVNPVYGSVGLMWSGEWEKCQAAVEAVLTGTETESESTTNFDYNSPYANLSLNSCDIRHVSNLPLHSADQLRKVKTRNRFKKPDHRTKPKLGLGSSHSHHDLGNGSIEVNPVSMFGNRSGNGLVELELSLNPAQ